MSSDSRFVLTPRSIIGVCIALAGVTLTLDRLNVLDADLVFRYWPLALIVIGGLMIGQSDSRRSRSRGIFFVVIGAWVFLSMQGLLSVSLWELFWPIMLIIIGASLALQTSRRGPRLPDGRPTTLASSRLTTFSVWSSCRRTSNANPFRGGDVTAVMGGAQLDLRTATIPPGEEATIDILAIMGGVEIWIPPHWSLSTPIVPFMGGVEDKRLPPLGDELDPIRHDAPRLVIRGFVMMGGVRISN